MAKTSIETVPLGKIHDIFEKHGIPKADRVVMLSWMVQLWLANEADMHYDLTKDVIELTNLDDMTKSMLVVEALPELVYMASLVHESRHERAVSVIGIKDHTITLEFFND